MTADGSSPHAQAVSVLSAAERTADRHVTEARDLAREIARDARDRGQDLAVQAREQAGRIMAGARADADQVLAGAREEAARVVSGAREEADQVRAAARLTARSALMTGEDLRRLQAETANLHALARAIRVHLRAYLSSLASSVDQWEQDEKDAVPQPGTGITR